MAASLIQNTTANHFSANTTAGSLLICVVKAIQGGSPSAQVPTINTPTTSGFTWTLAESSYYNYTYENDNQIIVHDKGRIAVYYIANASSLSSGTTTSCTASAGTVSARMYEFSGVLPTSPVDTTVANDNSTDSPTTVTAGNITLSQTDMVFVASTAYPSPGSGYTSGVVAGDQYDLTQAAGSDSTNFGSTDSEWACVAVAFKIPVSVTVSPSGVSSAFAEQNPSIAAGAVVSTSGLSATFALGLVYAPQPGTAYPNRVSALFRLGTVTATLPVNYGNVVSGSASIPGGINSTYFYARMIGFLTVPTTGVYTIGVNASDGVGLYIGTQPIVRALSASQAANSSAAYTNSNRVELTAGVSYPIVIEWAHGSGSNYELQLLWTLPGTLTPVVVPNANLALTRSWWNTSAGSPYPTAWY